MDPEIYPSLDQVEPQDYLERADCYLSTFEYCSLVDYIYSSHEPFTYGIDNIHYPYNISISLHQGPLISPLERLSTMPLKVSSTHLRQVWPKEFMACMVLTVEVSQVNRGLYGLYYLDLDSDEAYLMSDFVGSQVAQKELTKPLVEPDEHPKRLDYCRASDMKYQDCHLDYCYFDTFDYQAISSLA